MSVDSNKKNNGMTQHTNASFDDELQELRRHIADMGRIAEQMLGESVAALAKCDAERAHSVVSADTHLDELQRKIEDLAVLTITRRHPFAIDLREIVSAINIAGDLERIGDLAKNIAKRAIAIRDEEGPEAIVSSVAHLAELVRRQLDSVRTAYGSGDDAAAVEVWRSDDRIDVLHTALFREVLTYMMEDRRSIGRCTHLLFCAKNLERIGDHTTNIAETIHYQLTGLPMRGDRPKSDASSLTSLH